MNYYYLLLEYCHNGAANNNETIITFNKCLFNFLFSKQNSFYGFKMQFRYYNNVFYATNDLVIHLIKAFSS